MIRFNICGTALTFDFGFFTVMALFFLFDPYGLAVQVVCACMIHESGHIIASALCGTDIREVHFHAGGIRMRTSGRINSFGNDIFILICGPLFNIAAALIYYCEGLYPSFSVNMIMGVYNLLPFRWLDGGSILRSVLEYCGIFSSAVTKAAAALTALLLIMLSVHTDSGSIIVYITLVFLAVSEFCY